jgi:hypothetical protein
MNFFVRALSSYHKNVISNKRSLAWGRAIAESEVRIGVEASAGLALEISG